MKLAGKTDTRKSSNKDKIIHGFGAVHYAALLNNIQALKILLPYEIALKTTDLSIFKSPHYPKSAF